MSRRLLLQSILKFREGIKSGTAKVQDIVEDYFKSSGKSVTDEDRAIIMNEFAESAPDNITPLIPPEGIMSKYKTATDDMTDAQKDATLSDFVAQSDRVYQNFVTKALIDLQNASKSDQQQMVKAIIGRKGMFKYLEPEDAKKLLDSVDNPGASTSNVEEGFFGSEDPRFYKPKTTEAERLAADEGVDVAETILPTKPLKGSETFDEILEKFGPKEEGIMTISERFKGSPGIDRREAAEFAKKMREAGIKNKDVKDILINKSNFPGGYLDLEQGKRAATTLARAADMKADTAIKQELLSELDEMKLDRSPRFFKEEFMGYDDFRSAEDAKKIEVNNAIVDDLEKMGVEDDIVMFIMGRAREINKKPFYTSGEDFVDIIKEELDFQGIDYDVEFYKNYFRELKDLMRTTEPRFMYGGVV